MQLVAQEVSLFPETPYVTSILAELNRWFSLQCFVDRCLSFCTFVLAIALCIILRFTASTFPFRDFQAFLNKTLNTNQLINITDQAIINKIPKMHLALIQIKLLFYSISIYRKECFHILKPIINFYMSGYM